jgi:hypothetical protein
MMNEEPMVVCAQNAAQARKMMKYEEWRMSVILLCVCPVRIAPVENARFAEEMYRTAQGYGAELALLFSDYPAVAAAQLIHRRGVRQVLVDHAADGTSPFAETIRRLLPRVKVVERGEGKCRKVSALPPPSASRCPASCPIP